MTKSQQDLDRLLAGIDDLTTKLAVLNLAASRRPLSPLEIIRRRDQMRALAEYRRRISAIPWDIPVTGSRREMIGATLRKVGLMAVYGLQTVGASLYATPPPSGSHSA